MISDGDTFTACFASDPGDDPETFAKLVRYCVRNGFGLHFVEPGSKRLACPLSPRQRTSADKAAREQAEASGRRPPRSHHCQHGAFVRTEDNPKAADQAHRVAKRLAAARGRMNLALDLSASRMVAVDCDSPEQNAAFLRAWSAATGSDESHRSYTVSSPGRAQIAADGTQTWVHHGGGHYLFTVPEGVLLPATPGTATGEGGWELKWSSRVMVPPSVREEGAYRVVGTTQRLPDWLRERIEASGQQAASERERRLQLPEREPGNDIDAYFAGLSWDQLLLPDGWVNGQTASCGCGTFTAPGPHGSPRSATAHDPDCAHLDRPGSGLLHLWTDSPPEFLAGAGRDVSKLTYLACSQHNGNTAAAMRSVGIAPAGATEHATQLAVRERGEQQQQLSTQQETAGVLAEAEDELFTAREDLRQLRDFMRTALVPVWAGLGAVLAAVAARVSPHVELPPVVGTGTRPVNLLIGIVGISGSGKSLALQAGADFLGSTLDVSEHELATGQGITAVYCSPPSKTEPAQQLTDTALFRIDEVDTMRSYSEMSGSALLPMLRSAWDGSRLGGAIKDRTRLTTVARGTYRFVALAGIQPSRSAVLLDDADGGTPQRWLFLPDHDPRTGHEPETTPEPLRWEPPAPLAAAGANLPTAITPARCRIVVPDEVRKTVRQDHIDRARGTGQGNYESHRMQLRLRVAAVLALLQHRLEISQQDWHLAGLVMRVSDAGRNQCQQALEENRRQQSRSRGIARGVEDTHREQVVVDAEAERVQACKDRVLRVLEQAGAEGTTKGPLRRSLTTGQRLRFEQAMAELHDDGQVHSEAVTSSSSSPAVRYWSTDHRTQ